MDFQREARVAGAIGIGMAVLLVPPAALVLTAHAGMGLPFWLGLGWACAGEVGASAMAGFLILNGLSAWRRTRQDAR